jgi:hypothetical protein
MHLYYFTLEKKGILRLVSELPLEVNDQGYIQVDINIEGHSLNMPVPSEMCFYFDGAMCLYSAPKEITDIVEKAIDTLDDVVLFMSGFQKFVAPILLGLEAKEKVKFRDALYTLNSYAPFCDEIAYCHIMVMYLEHLSKLDVIGNNFEVKSFFTAIRKDK